MCEQCFELDAIQPDTWRQKIETEHTGTDCRCLELFYGFLVRCLSFLLISIGDDCSVKAYCISQEL